MFKKTQEAGALALIPYNEDDDDDEVMLLLWTPWNRIQWHRESRKNKPISDLNWIPFFLSIFPPLLLIKPPYTLLARQIGKNQRDGNLRGNVSFNAQISRIPQNSNQGEESQ